MTGDKTSKKSAEDRELVARALSGDKDAYGKLFEKYRSRVFGTVFRLLRSEDAALDVVQDAFIKAYQSLEGLRGDSVFYPWVRTIAVHLAIDRVRSSRRRGSVSYNEELHGDAALGEAKAPAAPADFINPLEKVERKEFNEAVWKALNELGINHRAVFVLYAVEDMSYRQISESLDCPIGTVMSRLYYARKELQERLRSFF